MEGIGRLDQRSSRSRTPAPLCISGNSQAATLPTRWANTHSVAEVVSPENRPIESCLAVLKLLDQQPFYMNSEDYRSFAMQQLLSRVSNTGWSPAH
jgi:hypothetical protein